MSTPIPPASSAAPTPAVTDSRCRWCGSPLEGHAKPLRSRLVCSFCGVGNTYPFPSADELDDAYSTWYRPESGRFSGLGDTLLKRSRGQLARRLNEIAPPGPVLDVGAGEGALLDALHASRPPCDRRRTQGDPPRHALGRPQRDHGSYAAIVFWHSLEHLPNPGAELERAAALLQPGGVLAVAVPNNDSLQAKVFGDRWLALDMPRHLTHITSRALIQKAEELRLRVERISYRRGGQVMFGWLHGLVLMLPGHHNLYDAIRRPEARSEPQSSGERLKSLATAVVLAPVAALGFALEVALGRGGTVYMEARRDG